jgi:hypothetical protein
MRVMVIVKATPDSEAGRLPPRELLAEMGAYNEELIRAGVFLSGDGLAASSQGARVHFAAGSITVTDGPFTGTGDLASGYWIWQVKSLAEAVEWMRRSPFRTRTADVEIRRVTEAEDFINA